MPPLETMDRHDHAVVWPFVRWAGDGEPVVGEPYEVKVRWVDGRYERRQPDGSSRFYDAVAVLAEEVEVGSLMWQGRETDLPAGSGSYTETSGVGVLYIVHDYRETTDIKGRTNNTRRTALLGRFRDTLPGVVT